MLENIQIRKSITLFGEDTKKIIILFNNSYKERNNPNQDKKAKMYFKSIIHFGKGHKK